MVSSVETAKFVRSLKVPVVDSSHAWPGLRLPRVHDDDMAIGAMAADFFLGRGYRHMAFCSPGRNPVARDRLSGFSRAAVAKGAKVAELLPAMPGGGEAWAELRRRLRRALPALPKSCGVFCVDDRLGAMVCDVAAEAGLAVPGDLAVLGVGNLEMACECSRVPLSSVALDPEAQGYAAAGLLEEVLGGKYGPWPQRMPPVRLLQPKAVVERASTRGVAAHDPALARAVAHLCAHPAEGLSIHALAAHAGVGHQKLYGLFAREFRCTPGEFAEQVRLRLACRLLGDPGKKLRAVAQESGFGTALRLHRAFGRKLGVSPGRWRKLHAAGRADMPAVLPGRAVCRTEPSIGSG
jgi:LacI family transcriptional regulator